MTKTRPRRGKPPGAAAAIGWVVVAVGVHVGTLSLYTVLAPWLRPKHREPAQEVEVVWVHTPSANKNVNLPELPPLPEPEPEPESPMIEPPPRVRPAPVAKVAPTPPAKTPLPPSPPTAEPVPPPPPALRSRSRRPLRRPRWDPEAPPVVAEAEKPKPPPPPAPPSRRRPNRPRRSQGTKEVGRGRRREERRQRAPPEAEYFSDKNRRVAEQTRTRGPTERQSRVKRPRPRSRRTRTRPRSAARRKRPPSSEDRGHLPRRQAGERDRA